ncbi:MAG: type II CRISPR-associated endonuclease Cas1 [Lachnospiraceae bacterium]|nr:type II CRISPR-associated endonuclease Cas1 [Lachnospiraceae bacterium]
MSWRVVVVSNSAKLDYQMGYLTVRQEATTKIHLSEISILLVESTAVSMTAYLLCELIKKKIKVIFCDEKRNPSSELLPFYGSHDTSMKIRRQIEWSKNDKTAVWTEIVAEKIRKQAELLKEHGRSEYSMLNSYIEELQFGDSTNREGHAAKVYFNALFGMDFTRASENSTNAALNYGYGIILSAFNREIAANGYSTQLGLFHDNMFNPFNLGSDLMEPFRPLIDRKVISMQPEKFEHEEKMGVLAVLNEEVSIGGKKEFINNAIKIYCKSIFDALNDKDPSLIKFYRNEL